MIIHSIFFYIFSIIAVFSAIMVTVSRNTVHSVFFLILDFITISCLFIMIGAEFIGMIMLIVYVGAVAVLFLFVVMMLNVSKQKNEWLGDEKNSNHIPIEEKVFDNSGLYFHPPTTMINSKNITPLINNPIGM